MSQRPGVAIAIASWLHNVGQRAARTRDENELIISCDATFPVKPRNSQCLKDRDSRFERHDANERSAGSPGPQQPRMQSARAHSPRAACRYGPAAGRDVPRSVHWRFTRLVRLFAEANRRAMSSRFALAQRTHASWPHRHSALKWSLRSVSRRRLLGFSEALICLSYSGQKPSGELMI